MSYQSVYWKSNLCNNGTNRKAAAFLEGEVIDKRGIDEWEDREIRWWSESASERIDSIKTKF